jgi:hypothetical protein
MPLPPLAAIVCHNSEGAGTASEAAQLACRGKNAWLPFTSLYPAAQGHTLCHKHARLLSLATLHAYR